MLICTQLTTHCIIGLNNYLFQSDKTQLWMFICWQLTKYSNNSDLFSLSIIHIESINKLILLLKICCRTKRSTFGFLVCLYFSEFFVCCLGYIQCWITIHNGPRFKVLIFQKKYVRSCHYNCQYYHHLKNAGEPCLVAKLINTPSTRIIYKQMTTH